MTREQLTVESRQVRSGPRGKISRVKSVIPSHQAGLRYHHNAIFQQSFNVPSNLFMNGGAKCTLRLQGSQYTRTKSFCLQFEVSHSSGCAYLPASHWFDRISIFTSGGSKHAQTITSSGIEAFYNVFENRALDGVLNLAGSTSSWSQPPTTMGAGSHTVCIPLTTFMDQSFMDLDSQGDLLIHLYPRAQGIGEGAAELVITCNRAACVIETDAITQKDREQSVALHKTAIFSRVFCNPTKVEYNAVALAPSQKHSFSLENLSGQCAGLFLYIKATDASLASAYTCIPIGNDALIDVCSQSNVSKWGSGQAVRDDYIRSYLWGKHFPGSTYLENRGAIFVPFSDSVKDAMAHGVRSGGFMAFDAVRDTLQVTPGADFPPDNYNCVLIAMMFKTGHSRGGEVTIESA